MAAYVYPENPDFVIDDESKLRQILTTDDVVASFVNAYIQRLLTNDAFLKEHADAINAAAAKLANITMASNISFAQTGYMIDARQANPQIEGTIAARIEALSDSDAGKSPIAHAVSDNTYGLGSDTAYGHVKLSDSTSMDSAQSAGIAATPKAVKTVYDRAVGLGERVWTVQFPASGFTGDTYPYEQTVSVAGMSVDYSPVWGVLNSGTTEANAKAISKSAGFIQSVTTGPSTVKVRCLKKPLVDLTLIGKGI